MDYGVTEPEDVPKPSEQDNNEKSVKPTGNETKKDNLPPPPTPSATTSLQKPKVSLNTNPKTDSIVTQHISDKPLDELPSTPTHETTVAFQTQKETINESEGNSDDVVDPCTTKLRTDSIGPQPTSNKSNSETVDSTLGNGTVHTVYHLCRYVLLFSYTPSISL